MTGPLDHVQLTLVDSTEKAMEFKRWLGERRRMLGVDTENGGFDYLRDEMRLIQFGDLNAGWAIPWKRWGGVAIEALNEYEGPTVLHNTPYDVKFITHNSGSDLKRWKWEWTNDTMTMAHLLDPLRPKGLKALGAMHVDPKAATAQKMLDEAMVDNKWTWATVPVDFPYYWIYGAMDPVITCHLEEKFAPEIQASYKDVYDLEMNTLRVVTAMMMKGARVDLDYCGTKQQELMDWVAQSRQYLADVWKIGNATSNPQVIAALQREGVEIPQKFTKGGAQSLDKEVLEEIVLKTDHPIATQVLAIRKAEKNVGPYFKNFLQLADAEDRVHPTIWAMGTRTARMSITDPALQTLPRKDPTVRNAFIASDGNVIITCDYDQIEARLCAHFAGDAGMIEAFAGDTDFFYGLASRIYSKQIADVLKEERQLTKNTTYGKIYGAGTEKMALTAKVPYDQMAAVVNAFDTQFPGVKQLQQRVNRAAHERYQQEGVAYIKTPMGRKLVADDNKEYTLTNYLIQSHAAEILKKKLVEMDAVGLGDYMILPVHDEVVFDMPREEADNAMKLIGETMCDMENYYVPITASPEMIDGPWGRKYE